MYFCVADIISILSLGINFEIARNRRVLEIDRFAVAGKVAYDDLRSFNESVLSAGYLVSGRCKSTDCQSASSKNLLFCPSTNVHDWTSQWFNSHCIFKFIHASHFGLVIPYTAYSHPAHWISPIYVFFFPFIIIYFKLSTHKFACARAYSFPSIPSISFIKLFCVAEHFWRLHFTWRCLFWLFEFIVDVLRTW